MNLIQELKALGVNTEEGLERMGGNSVFYERMLFKLRDLIKDSPVRMDFDCSNYSDIIEAAHTIKGAAGNLAVTPIYKSYSEIIQLLRKQQPEQAKKVLEEVLPVQTAIIDCIGRYS